MSSSSGSDRGRGADPVEIARVVRAHGLRGQIVVRSHADDPRLLLEVDSVTLEGAPGSIPHRVEGRQPLRKRRDGSWLVRLSLGGLKRREQAERWVGSAVTVPAETLETVRDGDLFWRDLIGMECLRLDGTSLGRVAEIWPRPGQDVLRVEGPEGSVWVPAADEWIDRVDLEARQLWVDLPEGFAPDD